MCNKSSKHKNISSIEFDSSVRRKKPKTQNSLKRDSNPGAQQFVATCKNSSLKILDEKALKNFKEIAQNG